MARSPSVRHPYILGAGKFAAEAPDAEPWTLAPTPEARAKIRERYGADRTGLDCRGFVIWCYQLAAKRDGFNSGGSVTGWINTDSMIEDARSSSPDLFRIATAPRPGTVIAYPSIRRSELEGFTADLGKRVRIGHVGIVERFRGAEWDPSQLSFWALLDVVQCGSSGSPAVRTIDGGLWGRAASYPFTNPITQKTSTLTRSKWGAVLLDVIV
jgi:hypothetical protein